VSLLGYPARSVAPDPDPDPDRAAAWRLWLEECAPAVHLGDSLGRTELAEVLAAAVELVVPGQPMAFGARERWWRAWLGVECDAELNLELATDRLWLASKLASRVPSAPFRDALGRWHVFGDRRR